MPPRTQTLCRARRLVAQIRKASGICDRLGAQASEIEMSGRSAGNLRFFWAMLLGFSGLAWLLKTPRLWPLAALPALVWCGLSSVATYASVTRLKPWLSLKLHGFPPLLGDATSWLITVLSAAVAIWLALLITPPLSGPALERIVLAVENSHGAKARAALPFLVEVWCGVRAMVVGFALVMPLLIASLLLDFFAPFLAPLSTAIKLLSTTLGLAWTLLDYPLTLRGMRMRARFRLLGEHWSATLGFGLGLLPFFWLPCCQLLSLPVGVIAATLFCLQALSEPPAPPQFEGSAIPS